MKAINEILNSPSKESAKLKEYLSEVFVPPNLDKSALIVSSYPGGSASLVERAYKYLLRFELLRKFPKYVHTQPWIAEYAMKCLIHKNQSIRVRPNRLHEISEGMLSGFSSQKWSFSKTLIGVIKEKFKRCINIQVQYIKDNGVDKNDLLEACLFLGQLDDFFHVESSAKLYALIQDQNISNMANLRTLYDHLETSRLSPDQHCILNPTFREQSQLFGTEVDLVIDETLVVIKTIKNTELDRATFHQLLCYYLLSEIRGIENYPCVPISPLGVYFSRHNYLWKVAMSSLGIKKDFVRAIRLLKEAVDKHAETLASGSSRLAFYSPVQHT